MIPLKSFRKFVGEADGTTAVEYGVMLAMILLVVLIGITAAGNGVKDWWTNIDTELDSSGF
ncbi:MAG: Flp family type IVb pilin [Fuerstiella sp.]